MNWFLKDDKTLKGEWITFAMTVAAYYAGFYGLCNAITDVMMFAWGCLIVGLTVMLWGGYMGMKTKIKYKELEMSMGKNNGNGKDDALVDRGGDSPAGDSGAFDSVNYPDKQAGQGRGK